MLHGEGGIVLVWLMRRRSSTGAQTNLHREVERDNDSNKCELPLSLLSYRVLAVVM